MWQCYKPDSIVTTFSAIFLIYLGLLHFLGITLAFLTRNVKVAVLNESKSVSIMIYTSTIIMVILTLTQFFSRKYMNISGAVNAGGIIFQATIFLALSFVPKVLCWCCRILQTTVVIMSTPFLSFQILLLFR